jgi:BMFP domain-containing protein YqiC
MSIINSISTLTAGMATQADRVEKTTRKLQENLAGAQNALAADSVSVSREGANAAAVSDAMHQAVIPPEGDVSTAVVDLLQAKFAYAANAKATAITSDVLRDVVNIVGRKES